MAQYKNGEIAHVANPIIMNGDSNLESKSDVDACYRRLKLKKNDPFYITNVHPKGGKRSITTYDGIYERDGVKYRILDLPEYNLWTKSGWEMLLLLKGRDEK